MNHSQPGVSARESENGTQEYAVGSFRFVNDTIPRCSSRAASLFNTIVSHSLQSGLMHWRLDAARNFFRLKPHRLVAAGRPEINNQR